MSINLARCCHLLVAIALLLAGTASAQEQGQYRSRIQLDPLGEIGRGSEISVDELEQQIDGIRDPYARSSATRHLARHYVEQKDYASAIAWYREALDAGGLSDVANREMLRELAQVYLLNENYREAANSLERALAIDLVAVPEDYLLLAQARYKQGDYVAVVAALDGIGAKGLKLTEQQMRQALALYYRAGAFEQCEGLLHSLLKFNPAEPTYWHQLASVYLQQNKRRQARDQLVLALEKGISFTQSELTLLVDLQAVTGNPYGAAQLLEQFMASQQLPRNPANQRKLFELWLQARERGKAEQALSSAARMSGDTELYLYLAQLQMEDREWVAMQQTVLGACEQQLEDRYVSRANLLLGVSQLKQGRERAARRAFINATLVGGEQATAAEWLQFMQAEPANEDELRRVQGPCYGSLGKRAELDSEVTAIESVAQTPVAEPVALTSSEEVPFNDKTIPSMRLYSVAQDMDLTELSADLDRMRSAATRLTVSLVKSGGTADGPLHLLVRPEGDTRLGVPVRGSVQARGRYRVDKLGAFKCISIRLPADASSLAKADIFRQSAVEAGFELTGERRLVFTSGAEQAVEIQFGIQ